jgi:hypothetical protein
MTDPPEPDWRDLDYWRRELRRKPPAELALAAPLWRQAVIFWWLEAAGASWSCNDRRVLLPLLPDCPARRALLYAARELELDQGELR